MKKRNFLLKILSLMCALALVFGSTTGLFEIKTRAAGTTTLDFSSADQLIGINKSSITDGKLSVGPIEWAWDTGRAVTNYKFTKGVTYDITFKYSAKVTTGYNFWVYYGTSGSDYNIINKDNSGNMIKQVLNGTNLTAEEEKTYSFTFTANQPDGYDCLGFRMQSGATGAAILIDDITIVEHDYFTVTLEANGGTLESDTVYASPDSELVLPTPERDGYFFKGWYVDEDFELPTDGLTFEEDVTLYAKWRAYNSSREVAFTFDEDDTDYWTCKSTYTDNEAVADSGHLSIPFDKNGYRKVLVTLDYKLQSNRKYALYYEYNSSAWVGTVDSSRTYVTLAGYDTAVNGAADKVAYFDGKSSGWNQIGTTVNKKTVVFQTGTITEGVDKLSFYFAFGMDSQAADGYICYLNLDNIKIVELPENASSDSYTNDFSDTENSVYNLNPNTLIDTMTDPDDESNSVLVLDRSIKSTIAFKLALPATLKAGIGYTISYRYKTNVETQSAETNSKLEIIGSNGITKDLGYTVGNAVDNSGYGKIYKDWQTRRIHFTLTDDEVGAGVLVLNISSYGYDTDTSQIYLDDIYLMPDYTINFNSNGGSEVETLSIPADSSVIELPVPQKDGWNFKGWCTDETLENLVDNTNPNANTTYYARWYIKGDADGDGQVTSFDMTVLKKFLLGVDVEYSKDGVCINDDATVDILDLIRLKKMLAGNAATVIPDGYNLVWSEEFNASSVDDVKLSTCTGHSYFENTVSSADNISLSDGKVKMTAKYDAESGKYVIPMSLSTGDYMNYKYGYVEIKAKLPYNGQKEWTAIWSIASQSNIAKKLIGYKAGEYMAEIDIVESMNSSDSFQTQIHLWDNDGSEHKQNILSENTYQFADTASANEWHIYGYKWTSESIEIYVDGVLVISKTFSEDDAQYFDTYLPLMLSLSTYEENTDLDASFEIDYIRLYQNAATDSLLVVNK